MQMVAHGLTAGLLFLVVGLLYQRRHSRDLADYGSLLGKAPRFAFFTAFGLLAAIGLPGSAGFIAELHALVGGYQRWGGWVLILCLAMLIGAAYSLRVIGRLCLKGKTMDLAGHDADRGGGSGPAGSVHPRPWCLAGAFARPDRRQCRRGRTIVRDVR